MQDYARAVDVYHKLIRLCPDCHDYYFYMAQALLLMGKYQQAEDIIEKAPQLQRHERSKILQAKIKFEKGDLIGSKEMLRRMDETTDVEIAHAAVLSMEGNYEEALEKSNHVLESVGFRPDVAYSIAHCHFRMDQHKEALVILDEIISRADEKPDIDMEVTQNNYNGVVDMTDKSVLLETFLIEALNLKIAIEYGDGKLIEARQTWNRMPIRGDEDIDAISLHNQAIIHMDNDTENGFSKLTYLLNNPPYPSETFTNLLLLCCKHGFEEQAADMIAENAQLLQLNVPTTLHEFLETFIIAKASSDEALRRLEKLSVIMAQNIRKMKKKVQDIKKRGDNIALKSATKGMKDSMQLFVPILMTQTKIFWDRFDYKGAERALQIAGDICNETDAWQINMAHALFMQQGDRYNDAISYYAALIKTKENRNLLQVSPIAIANLCVAYIMVNRNEEAETMLTLLQKQEEHFQYDHEHGTHLHHSCIVNLVIGTLYCERGNFDFGIERICKSLQPFEDKLGADTWYYVKLCLLALIDKMSKQMVVISERLIQSIHNFLDDVYDYGADVSAALVNPLKDGYAPSKNMNKSISDDARKLKYIFLQLMMID